MIICLADSLTFAFTTLLYNDFFQTNIKTKAPLKQQNTNLAEPIWNPLIQHPVKHLKYIVNS